MVRTAVSRIIACLLIGAWYGVVSVCFAEDSVSSSDRGRQESAIAGAGGPIALPHGLAKAEAAKPIRTLGATGNGQAHRRFVPNATEPVVRNAIGVAVSRPPGRAVQEDETHAILPPNSAPALRINAGAAVKPLAATEGQFERTNIMRPGSPVIPGSAVIMSARGATKPPATFGEINGTTLNRRVSAPLPLGGPAKTAAGINGTTFRPKH
jgi:hypothetical protein